MATPSTASALVGVVCKDRFSTVVWTFVAFEQVMPAPRQTTSSSNINQDLRAASEPLTSASARPATPKEFESTAPPTQGCVLVLL